ncbi:MAG TPA: hypothetical protein PLE61_13695 [Vicinamibacterales bacterium]|nr:hypothetical protein [Vicinamibacterales bacterium]HPW21854.1 hypothetical protein [Vicinamibacterales bacterium]
MNRCCPALLLSLFLVMPAAPALAQDAESKKVTLDLNAVAPQAAFNAVAEAIGVTASVDPSLTSPVDIAVRHVSARTALTAICESIGCTWELTSARLVVRAGSDASSIAARVSVGGKAATPEAQAVVDAFRKELPAGLNFEHAPLADVNKRLSEAVGLPVELKCRVPDVTTLTMDFSGLTLQGALQKIGEREERPKAAWQLIVGPAPGAKAPQIAIAVGPAKQ